MILTPEFRPWVVPFEVTGDSSNAKTQANQCAFDVYWVVHWCGDEMKVNLGMSRTFEGGEQSVASRRLLMASVTDSP